MNPDSKPIADENNIEKVRKRISAELYAIAPECITTDKFSRIPIKDIKKITYNAKTAYPKRVARSVRIVFDEELIIRKHKFKEELFS